MIQVTYDLTLFLQPDLPNVLHHINFSVTPSEKVSIQGGIGVSPDGQVRLVS